MPRGQGTTVKVVQTVPYSTREREQLTKSARNVLVGKGYVSNVLFRSIDI